MRKHGIFPERTGLTVIGEKLRRDAPILCGNDLQTKFGCQTIEEIPLPVV
jgi:hypothetical protein